MNYANIKTFDIANGPGVRISLFVSGCRHGCKGCFNKEAQSFKYGKIFNKNVEDNIIKQLNSPLIDGLSLLGGEPLEPENQKALLPFIQRVKKESPSTNIWLWTGFTFEDILNDSRANTPEIQTILETIDVLVDGPFIEEEKDITLRFRGSKNQRILDSKESIKHQYPITWHDDKFFETHSM